MKYLSAPYYAYSFDNSSVALYVPHIKETVVVDKVLFYAIKGLSTPKTIDELTNDLQKQTSDIPPLSERSISIIKTGIEDLRTTGIIFSKSDIEKFMRSLSSGRKPEITSIGWPTKNNPELLRRSMVSAKLMLTNYDKKASFIICDDETEEQSRVPSMLTRMQADDGGSAQTTCIYIGEKEKRGFLRTISKSGGLRALSEEVLDFLFFGSRHVAGSFGGNRNTLLLATRGEYFLSTDDDTEFRYTRHYDECRGIEFSQNESLNTVSFFTNLGELDSTVTHKSVDILKVYENIFLAKTSDCSSDRSDDDFFFDAISTDMLAAFMNDPERKVQLCMCGISGDSGLRGPEIVFHLPEKMRKPLLENPARFNSALSNRIILRSALRPILSLDGVFMTTQFAADNTSFLPPFFPCGRGEDSVFASLLSLCSGAALQAYPPFAVSHRPSSSRNYMDKALSSIETRCCDFLTRIIFHYRNCLPINVRRERNPSEKLYSFARFLIDKCNENDRRFAAFLTSVNTEYLSRYIKNLETEADAVSGAPDFYFETFEKHRSSVRDYLCSENASIPSDIALDAEQSRLCFKKLLRNFAHILGCWPVILKSGGKHAFDFKEFSI